MREAVRHPAPPRTRPTRVAVDRTAARSRWIEAFYIAEAKAQLDHQSPGRHGGRVPGRPLS
ncbi:MAG TPA: hypothetical protein VFY44_08115 [Thermoleophilaceae bacterium]|nr:hypothetical protein [Thermoleophilaceae bacterium]